MSELAGATVAVDAALQDGSPLHVFTWALFMIVLSEIGDKTFFIAAVLAMDNPRLIVFLSAFAALFAMTVLSAVVGHMAPLLFPPWLSQLAAGILFIVFGVKMLLEAKAMTGNEGQEELLEVVQEIEQADSKGKYMEEGSILPTHNIDSPQGVLAGPKGKKGLFAFVPKVVVQAFVMTFLGEWGDRSQIATVAMAGAQNFAWVIVGSLVGHALCTGLAVLGGRLLANKISVKSVSVMGGILFLLFGIVALYQCIADSDMGRASIKDVNI